MQVTLEEAYAEACRVIGEQIVTQRLLSRAEAQHAVADHDEGGQG